MILDTTLQFAAAQDVTTAVGSTNTIDLSAALRNIGVGESLLVAIKVTTAFTDSGSDSSVSVALEGDSSESFSPDATMPLMTIPALAAAGNDYYAKIDCDFALAYRYIRLKFTPVGGDLTTGAVSAFLTLDAAQKYTNYAKGFRVS